VSVLQPAESRFFETLDNGLIFVLKSSNPLIELVKMPQEVSEPFVMFSLLSFNAIKTRFKLVPVKYT
jgi:hypothetical protein